MNVNDVKVIIIDDHTLVRAGIARLIDSEPGLSVVGEASNVTEGADMLRRVPAARHGGRRLDARRQRPVAGPLGPQ